MGQNLKAPQWEKEKKINGVPPFGTFRKKTNKTVEMVGKIIIKFDDPCK